jgi:hypothetical protein
MVSVDTYLVAELASWAATDNGARKVSDEDRGLGLPETPPIVRELQRIFGDQSEFGMEQQPLLMLPLQGDEVIAAFLRTVPTGTSWEALEGLAVAYRAAHPGPP